MPMVARNSPVSPPNAMRLTLGGQPCSYLDAVHQESGAFGAYRAEVSVKLSAVGQALAFLRRSPVLTTRGSLELDRVERLWSQGNHGRDVPICRPQQRAGPAH